MINRTRMLLDDLDSEGFPIPYPREFAALAAVNIGRIADHAMVQAILADHKCLNCATPSVALSVFVPQTPPDIIGALQGNPKGWDEVDGVKLPPITWSEPAWATGQPTEPLDMSEFNADDDIGGYPTEAEVQQARHLLELAEQRKLVDEADAKMDQFVGKAAADHFRAYFDGVKRLSDSAAPVKFVGVKR